MISDARGGHVSPGIYSEEKDVTYSVKSLGITNLGLVGETLYGPAFENIPIKDWSEFIDYFGGTSPEKFKGTDLPKYELPYIAKSYLEESKQLNVVRVLGLSGYEAGKAWVIKKGDNIKAVLRSKIVYGHDTNLCSAIDPDSASEVVTNVSIGSYNEVSYNAVCGEETGSASSAPTTPPDKFSINVTCNTSFGYEASYNYNVSLNPNDSDYILNVLGDNPTYGTSPIYVECVFSNNGNETGNYGVSGLSGTIYTTPSAYWRLISPAGEAVDGYYLWEYEQTDRSSIGNHPMSAVTEFTSHISDINESIEFCEAASAGTSWFVCASTTNNIDLPKYIFTGGQVTFNIEDAYTNYHEMYRPAQTPWVVSDVTATFSNNSASSATMHKLFKFITISDGNVANYQVKITISRINPIDGTFDVLVRDYNDTDDNIVILEKFSRCNLVPSSKQYIANKIGTYDGTYESRSKYITVAMATEEGLDNYIPAGFLGYPIPSYEDMQTAGDNIQLEYSTAYDPNIKAKRQYFGLTSDNIIPSVFSYKGKFVYSGIEDSDPMFLTNGFHMDSILNEYNSGQTFVDGFSGYKFTSVSQTRVGSETRIPRLINANYIYDTIYNDINVRKFTMCFYGGFDGWDVHEASRTNTDEYSAAKYITNKRAKRFTPVGAGIDGVLNLPSNAITSDYYAYLAGYRVFANPQDIDINIFATPGIDWYNNRLLTEDVINIIEDSDDGRGGDALYIINSPRDLTVNDITYELEMSEINTSYGATYYPWIKYYDSSNGRYVEVSPTKDVVRNLARTDNNSFPWFAPAGMDRGSVNCVRALYKTTLADEDELYANRVNPVKTFSRDGVKIWGNKTLYTTDSPLNRINVRRLMIRVKKLIVDAAKNLIFEQYDDTLEKQFRGLVEPILADVKANRGISDYRIMTEVTPETRDEHILPAKILIKPTPALEYISITFVVYPQSVSFEE